MDNAKNNTNNNLKTILDESLDLSLNQIRRLLSNMSPPEIAHALESSPPKQRNVLFSLLKTEEEGDVLLISRGLGSGVLFAAKIAGRTSHYDLDSALADLSVSQHELVSSIWQLEGRSLESRRTSYIGRVRFAQVQNDRNTCMRISWSNTSDWRLSRSRKTHNE